MVKLPYLTVGVDEFTLILQPTNKVIVIDWPDTMNEIIDVFVAKSRLMDLFGEMAFAEKVPAGYTNGVTFACRPWYLVISWHDDFPSMGICVRFSAHAYASYKEELSSSIFLFSQSFIVAPITSYPCCFNKIAATLLSTPPAHSK